MYDEGQVMLCPHCDEEFDIHDEDEFANYFEHVTTCEEDPDEEL